LKNVRQASQWQISANGQCCGKNVSSAIASEPSACCAGSPAARLAAVGARLLPEGDRGRHAAEYLSELWDLADAGAGWWRQVRHAFLLTARVPELRGALREPRRRNAAPWAMRHGPLAPCSPRPCWPGWASRP
jgi:hypothetical protein